MFLGAIVLVTLWTQTPTERNRIELQPEVIHAAYPGQFDEQKPKFIYEFYSMENQPIDSALATKNNASTIRDLDSIVSRNQNFPLIRDMAMSMILFCYNIKGEYPRTIGVGEAYLRTFPRGSASWRANLLYSLAEAHYYNHDYQDAERLYLKIKNDYPGQGLAPFASGSLAWVFLNQGRYPEAFKLFQDLYTSSDNPTVRVFAIYGAGHAMYRQASFDTAIRFFAYHKDAYDASRLGCALAYDLIPDNYYWSGFCWEKMAKPDTALEVWQMLLTEYPDSPRAAEATFRIGNIYFRKNNYGQAVPYFRQVLTRFPNSAFVADANSVLAQSYFNLGDDREAQKYYEQWLKLLPEDSVNALTGMDESKYRMAKVSSTARALDDILVDYVRFLPRSEHLPELRFELGLRYSNEKNFLQAAAHFQQVVLTYSGSRFAPDAQIKLGVTYDTLGDYKGSIEAYRWFLENFPGHPSAPMVVFRTGMAFMAQAAKSGDRNFYRHALQTFIDLEQRHPGSDYAAQAAAQKKICEQKLR